MKIGPIPLFRRSICKYIMAYVGGQFSMLFFEKWQIALWLPSFMYNFSLSDDYIKLSGGLCHGTVLGQKIFKHIESHTF